MTPRPVVIGGGVNGLVTAFYLARAGLAPLVLERGDRIGGAATTRELVPGVHVPTLAHAIGPIRPDVAEDLQLAAQGVRWLQPDVSSLTPVPGGRPIVLTRDPWKAAVTLARHSERDAARYPQFVQAVAEIGGIAAELAADAPPSIDAPTAGEMWRLLKVGRRFRGLGRQAVHRALRWAPMAVADLLEDWFDTDALRGTLATRGVFASALGPRSAGTAALLLLEASRQPEAPLAPVFVQGGPGALSAAIAVAATQAGAQVRCRVEVTRIETADDGVTSVVTSSGEQIAASIVVSDLDPKATFLRLIDPVRLDPDVLQRLRNYRVPGTVAKVNLVVDGLPSFIERSAIPDGVSPDEVLSGRILVAPSIDAIDRAFDASKYGQWSPRPWLECVVPTIMDPGLTSGGRHVISVYAQYAPYRLRSGNWNDERDAFTRAVIETLAECAPELPSRIVAGEALTPADLEHDHGYTGGHIHHGEMALDQLFVMRPLLGWAQHRTPVGGLYLCGAGTHPGGGITGANGANAARAVLADLARRK